MSSEVLWACPVAAAGRVRPDAYCTPTGLVLPLTLRPRWCVVAARACLSPEGSNPLFACPLCPPPNTHTRTPRPARPAHQQHATPTGRVLVRSRRRQHPQPPAQQAGGRGGQAQDPPHFGATGADCSSRRRRLCAGCGRGWGGGLWEGEEHGCAGCEAQTRQDHSPVLSATCEHV